MDLPEEHSQRESNENVSRYIRMQSEANVGFSRKLNAEVYGKKSGIRSKLDYLFDTLDEKAKLSNQFKNLSQYQRKGAQPPTLTVSEDAHPIILVKWNHTLNIFELNEEAVNVPPGLQRPPLLTYTPFTGLQAKERS